jgi:hypothetical protein
MIAGLDVCQFGFLEKSDPLNEPRVASGFLFSSFNFQAVDGKHLAAAGRNTVLWKRLG